LQHGQNQLLSAKSFCELPGSVNHEFGDYMSLAFSVNLGVNVPDRLDQIYTRDIRILCEDAWKNFGESTDLKFFEHVKLKVAQVFNLN
jgi:hypothetical protein